ncbi:hypothetical protein [Amedibacillus sp. YH-ame10]
MDQENLHSQEKHLDDKQQQEIFDVMRNENEDVFNEVFTFRTVLFTAIILGIVILVFYFLGSLR